ncbi:hypothetical protein PO909_029947 [Leuciscus waleckii]
MFLYSPHLADVCKKKWKGLRDTFKKNKNREKEASRSGAGLGVHKHWKYSAIMSFLTPFLEFRESSSNFSRISPPSTTNRPTSRSECPGIQCKDSPSSQITPELQDRQRTQEYHHRTECPAMHPERLGSQFNMENCPSSPNSVSSWPASPVPSHSQCSQPPASPAKGSGRSTQPEECVDSQPLASLSSQPQPQRKRVRKDKMSSFEKRMLSVVESASSPAPNSAQHYDEDELFLQSILPVLKRLPMQKRSEVKLNMHRLLYEADVECNKAV